MRRALALSLVFLASCEGLLGVDFDDATARAPREAGANADASVVAGPCTADELRCVAGGASRCVAKSDPATGCGIDPCAPCPGAEHGAAICEDRRCAVACDQGFRRCRTGCCAIVEAPIAAGVAHTCAAARSGALYCWGYNAGGQLGDNSRESRTSPVLVFGLEGGVRGVAVSVDATYAVSASGATLAWGANTLGTLGDGTHTSRATPVPVLGLASDIRYVVGGSSHACAVTRTGVAWCWGYNPSGVVGSGSSTLEVPLPERLAQTEPIGALATGTAHACAIGISGALYCWGSNAAGQLGIAGAVTASVPTRVPGATDIASVAGGVGHTCVVTGTGGVRCWGANGAGQLGVGDTEARADAVDVLPPSIGVRGIVAGDAFTCATLASGALRCWGSMAITLGVGAGPTDIELRPAAVDVGGPVAAVSAGSKHACARLLDGRVRCWGANNAGQLGDGTREDKPLAVDVALPK